MLKNNFSQYTLFKQRYKKGINSEQQDKREIKSYSEFESFINGLIRLYPMLLMLSIPEKHTFGENQQQKIKDFINLPFKLNVFLKTMMMTHSLIKESECSNDSWLE